LSIILIMKKWFTIFEMLLVVVIMWILMAAFKDFFLSKDKNKIYFDTCVARTYWQLNTFLWDAMTQKTVYSGDTYISPELYQIKFDETNQKLNFIYDFTWGVSWTAKTTLFSWVNSRDLENKCWEGGYFTKIKSTLDIKIKPGLQQTAKAWEDTAAFLIDDDLSTITGEAMFLFCEWPNNCMERTKIIFDRRTFNIDKKTCLKNTLMDVNQDNACDKWSE